MTWEISVGIFAKDGKPYSRFTYIETDEKDDPIEEGDINENSN